MEKVDDIYTLSPIQQGLLFHALYAPQTGSYIIQVSCILHGSLQIPAFAQAWQHIMAQHPVLRTSFHWRELNQPLQVIHQQVSLRIAQHDWRLLTPDEQSARFQAFLEDDRRTGFDPLQPPLMRIALLRHADDTYRFLWSFHHLLLDGWSMGLVLQHVFASYVAFRSNQPASAHQGPPFASYIAWLQRQDRAQAARFWQQVLGDVTHPTRLADDRSTGSGYGAHPLYQHRELRLNPSATTMLRTFSQQQQITLNTLVQGAWALVLNRYSGESDVVFGVTVAGRPATLPDVERMVGPCINTLPVRIKIAQNQPIHAWLEALQMHQAEVSEYAYSPLVEIQGWSGVPRHQPLFESILVFENYPLDRSMLELDEHLAVRAIKVEEQTNYPLTVIGVPGAEFSLQLAYDSRYVDDTLASILLGQMKLVLESMVAHPERPLADLPRLTAAEYRQVVQAWNDTQTTWPLDACIHQLFELQAAQAPDTIAVVCEEAYLTYGELNRRANQLGHHLRRLGVGPEVMVGLCVDRSLAMIVGLLGILKAGGAYVPLDPSYPWERLAFILEDTRAPVLVTQDHLVGPFVGRHAQIVCLESSWPLIAERPGENPNSGVAAHNAAYCIYTSGSSGRPKGVLVVHRGLCNVTRATIQTFNIRKESHVFQFASISFDASIWQICMALHSGARLDLFQRGAAFSIQTLVRRLQAQFITVADLPPSVLDLLPAEELPTLQTVSTGGERCTVARAVRWSAGRRFFNVYGPTETTVAAAWYLVETVSEATTNVPIGRPIANTRLYLLDRYLQPLPIGAKGELYIGGAGLARGYLGQPDLTAERFVPNPFLKDEGGRMKDEEGRFILHPSSFILYRTGDLARYRPDGSVEFIGRADYQVKVRGFRIELEEIESVLMQHPDLSAAAVIVRERSPSDAHLVAYVVARREPAPSSSAVRDFLLGRLPSHMVPGTIVFLSSLPLLPNRKVDRQALPAPNQAGSTPDMVFVAPRTEAERAIAAVWRAVLEIEEIGIYDNFFDLGGHSVRMIQVHSQLQQRFERELSMVELFQYPTIDALARHLSDSQPAAATEQRIQMQTQKQKAALNQYRRRRMDRNKTKGIDDDANTTSPDV